MSDRPPKVLVVDDEENIRFLVESALQLAGMDTAGADDGRSGGKRFRSQRKNSRH